MNTSNHFSHLPVDVKQETNYLAIVVRLFWVLVGVAILAMIAFFLANNRESIFSLADVAYGAMVVLLIGARYLDVVKFHGLTSEGDRPATLQDWRCYVRNLILGSGITWFVAHGIALLLMQ